MRSSCVKILERFNLVVFSGFIGLLSLTGCGQICETTGDCPSGSVCLNGYCSEVPVNSGCLSGGIHYAPGESFPAPDGCNTCTCDQDGFFYCTEIFCPIDCNTNKVVCQQSAPTCPAGQVPTVVNGCFGLCTSVYLCQEMECSFAPDCPPSFHCEGSSVCPPNTTCPWIGKPGTCVLNGPDYGVEGDACVAAHNDCQPEFVCCYPCALPGCEFECTDPCQDDDSMCQNGCPAVIPWK